MVPRSLGIIGYGQFGRFIEKLVRTYSPELEVRIWSRSATIDNETFFSLEEVCQSDIVVLTVSIRAFEEMLVRVIPLLSASSVLVEVNTVKEHPVKLLHEHASSVRYIATHPMFGPYSFEKQGNSLEGLRLVIAEHTLSESEYTSLTSFLQGLGLEVLQMTAEAHDRMLAETLFLTHYLAQSVAAAGFVRTDIDTLSFGYLMDAVESVKNDTELFKDVFEFNPYCKETIRRFEAAEGKTRDLLEG